MRFVQFINRAGAQRLGIQQRLGGDIVDLNAGDSTIPNTLLQFLNGGKTIIDKARRLSSEAKCLVPLSEVRLLAPITRPDKVACVGLNYRGHCEEQNLALPPVPIVFSKFSSAITGPFDDIKYPVVSDEFDWEVELAVIVGKEGFNIPLSNAMDHVFGYTVAQDVSARDWQKKKNGGQFLLGKTMDTSCPLGPVIVTRDDIPDVYNLSISSKINGVLKQKGNTGELIHKIDAIISRISSCVTLLPGDVILTGTPGGVGMHRSPPEFLKPGDIITSEIQEIGIMENKVVARS